MSTFFDLIGKVEDIYASWHEAGDAAATAFKDLDKFSQCKEDIEELQSFTGDLNKMLATHLLSNGGKALVGAEVLAGVKGCYSDFKVYFDSDMQRKTVIPKEIWQEAKKDLKNMNRFLEHAATKYDKIMLVKKVNGLLDKSLDIDSFDGKMKKAQRLVSGEPEKIEKTESEKAIAKEKRQAIFKEERIDGLVAQIDDGSLTEGQKRYDMAKRIHDKRERLKAKRIERINDLVKRIENGSLTEGQDKYDMAKRIHDNRKATSADGANPAPIHP